MALTIASKPTTTTPRFPVTNPVARLEQLAEGLLRNLGSNEPRAREKTNIGKPTEKAIVPSIGSQTQIYFEFSFISLFSSP